MIVVLDVPGRALRVAAMKVHRKPVGQRARLTTIFVNQVAWEALQQGLSSPEAYARAASYGAALRERVEFLDAALGHPGASIHRLPSRNIYRRRKEIA
jgi:hypothetical protein